MLQFLFVSSLKQPFTDDVSTVNLHSLVFPVICTGLFEMTVGEVGVYVFFYLIEQHSNFLLCTLQVLYMCILCDSTNINTIIESVPNCL